MSRMRRTLPKALTREQWLNTALICRQDCGPARHPRERRKRKREPIRAIAALTFRPGGRLEEETTYWNCPVVDATDEGLCVRSYRKIPVGTHVSIEVGVLDKRFMLAGKITHSTGFPGNVRVGIQLEFQNPDDRAEKPAN